MPHPSTELTLPDNLLFKVFDYVPTLLQSWHGSLWKVMAPPQLLSLLVLDGIPPTVWNESPVVPPLAAYSCLRALHQLFSAWKPRAPPTPAWETPTQLSQRVRPSLPPGPLS